MSRALPWLCSLALGCAVGDVGNTVVDDPDQGAPDAAEDCASAIERCNGTDDDCDGRVDEGLRLACGEASEGCPGREQRCEEGAWTECPPPAAGAETCNDQDDDCDGATDEGLIRPCGVAVGACTAGIERCQDGQWIDCSAVGMPGALAEDCAALDDEDCDGTADEGCACVNTAERPCGVDVGRCTAGTQPCDDGTWGACAGAIPPTVETCDGTDEDCDGATDEALERPCGSGVGACLPGVERCIEANWNACEGGVRPGVEACDGSDQDCDGVADEGLARPCGGGMGACGAGEQRCVEGAWGACAGEGAPGDELCNGRGDEDCDGRVDEGCDCADGETRPCGNAEGACEAGEQVCANGAWGACAGEVGPGEEVCDGRVDEDCDGRVDEGCDCIDGDQRPCGSDVGVCTAGMEACTDGAWAACIGATPPAAEVCDGRLDQDCDGQADEGCRCTNGEARGCGTDEGQCRRGQETCADGRWGVCAGGVAAVAEACGAGRDEDCDGRIDEGHRARVREFTYANLARQHPDCEGNRQRFGDNCLSAIHRSCGDGCKNTGWGPIENSGGNAAAVCLLAATPAQVSFATLRTIQPRCVGEDALSEVCSAAIDSWCVARGHGAGFGPVEHANGNAFVNCLSAAQIDRFWLDYADLARHQPACNGNQQRIGPECASAAHRVCAGRGHASGVAPIQTNGLRVEVACFRN